MAQKKKDTIAKEPKYTPKIKFVDIFKKDKPGEFYIRKASYRSLILPGWGQVYNKKYWKAPLAVACVGIPVAIFIRNRNQFLAADRAYQLASDGDPANDYLIKPPYDVVASRPEVIRSFRNQVRTNIDYSALAIIIGWGVQVADATVDAHLKSFNVSNDLSLNLNAGYNDVAGNIGISLNLIPRKKANTNYAK